MASRASGWNHKTGTAHRKTTKQVKGKAGHGVSHNATGGNVILRSTTPAKTRAIAQEKLIIKSCR